MDVSDPLCLGFTSGSRGDWVGVGCTIDRGRHVKVWSSTSGCRIGPAGDGRSVVAQVGKQWIMTINNSG